MLSELAYPTPLYHISTGEYQDELTTEDFMSFVEYADRTGFVCHLTPGHLPGDKPGSIGKVMSFKVEDGRLMGEVVTDKPLSPSEGFSIEYVRNVFSPTDGTFIPFLVHRVAATSDPKLRPITKLTSVGSMCCSMTSIHQGDKNMDKIAAALGLPSTATESEILEALGALTANVANLQTKVIALEAHSPRSQALSRINMRKGILKASGENEADYASFLDEEMVEHEIQKGKDFFPYDRVISLSRSAPTFKTPPQPVDGNETPGQAKAKRIIGAMRGKKK